MCPYSCWRAGPTEWPRSGINGASRCFITGHRSCAVVTRRQSTRPAAQAYRLRLSILYVRGAPQCIGFCFVYAASRRYREEMERRYEDIPHFEDLVDSLGTIAGTQRVCSQKKAAACEFTRRRRGTNLGRRRLRRSMGG